MPIFISVLGQKPISEKESRETYAFNLSGYTRSPFHRAIKGLGNHS